MRILSIVVLSFLMVIAQACSRSDAPDTSGASTAYSQGPAKRPTVTRSPDTVKPQNTSPLTLELPMAGMPVQITKNPGCGCCEAWADYLKKQGASVIIEEAPSAEQRLSKTRIPSAAASCHHAYITGFIFEGHVPVQSIKKFLADPVPDAIGLSVPGMPMASPGMDVGHEPYDVMVMMRNGDLVLFETITPSSIK